MMTRNISDWCDTLQWSRAGGFYSQWVLWVLIPVLYSNTPGRKACWVFCSGWSRASPTTLPHGVIYPAISLCKILTEILVFLYACYRTAEVLCKKYRSQDRINFNQWSSHTLEFVENPKFCFGRKYIIFRLSSVVGTCIIYRYVPILYATHYTILLLLLLLWLVSICLSTWKFYKCSRRPLWKSPPTLDTTQQPPPHSTRPAIIQHRNRGINLIFKIWGSWGGLERKCAFPLDQSHLNCDQGKSRRSHLTYHQTTTQLLFHSAI